MTKNKNEFLAGYIFAVATLVRSHGSTVEARDLLACVEGSEAIRQSADASDVRVLEEAGLLKSKLLKPTCSYPIPKKGARQCQAGHWLGAPEHPVSA